MKECLVDFSSTYHKEEKENVETQGMGGPILS